MKTAITKTALYALTVLSLGSALMTTSYADTRTERALSETAVYAVVDTAQTRSESEQTAQTESAVSSSKGVLSYASYVMKVSRFLCDKRWKNGVKWNGSKKPAVSKHRCSGCMAYAVDFCKYVYGEDWATSSKKFKTYKNVNEIATGDAIRINGHYFVVLQRRGNKLYTAEGNYSGKVRASLSAYGYYIQGNRLYQNWYNANGTSRGSTAVTFISGYRHK